MAEFVESEPQLDKLIEIGIDYGQGYLLDKPSLLFDPMAEGVSA